MAVILDLCLQKLKNLEMYRTNSKEGEYSWSLFERSLKRHGTGYPWMPVLGTGWFLPEVCLVISVEMSLNHLRSSCLSKERSLTPRLGVSEARSLPSGYSPAFSSWLLVLTAPIVAPNFTVEDTSADSILVKWDDIPVEELRGFLRGYLFYFQKGERDTPKTRSLETSE